MFDDAPILFVSWRSPGSRLLHPVGRLICEATTPHYEFSYIRSVNKAIAQGFTPFPEFPDLRERYRSTQLFPLFSNRVMRPSRPGYSAFLSNLGLSGALVNPMAILARTGGRRETDQIEMFPLPIPDGQPGCYVTHCLLRSIRYMPQPATEERIAKLQPGEKLFVMPDPQNPVDTNALAVRTSDNFIIGYVPSYLTSDLQLLQNDCRDLQVFVDRVNPSPAEVHHRLLCKIVSCWPPSFRPFDTVEFRPLHEMAGDSGPYPAT